MKRGNENVASFLDFRKIVCHLNPLKYGYNVDVAVFHQIDQSLVGQFDDWHGQVMLVCVNDTTAATVT